MKFPMRFNGSDDRGEFCDCINSNCAWWSVIRPDDGTMARGCAIAFIPGSMSVSDATLIVDNKGIPC